MEKKYDMNRGGIGRGSFGNKIRLISVQFEKECIQILEDEARPLIIKYAHEFLDAANNDEKIKPFLVKYPLTLENIDFGIFCSDKNFADVYHPYISSFGSHEGKSITSQAKKIVLNINLKN